jgi:hypothetical protein
MIVIARSGNNNVGHIVTVGLGERPVPRLGGDTPTVFSMQNPFRFGQNYPFGQD